MELITKEQLKNLSAGQKINGIILVKDYSIQLTKTNKEYVAGTLQSGADIYFKSWGSSSAFSKFKLEDYKNTPAYIVGSVDDYGGSNSIIVESVQAVEGYTPDQFYPIRYNIDAYWSALKGQIDKRVSDKGKNICDSILFNNEELSNRFKNEFAAKSHHDNCKGGLLAHTYKVLNNIANIVTMYPALVTRENGVDSDFIDLLYIGALLHDIGKTVEMEFGVYQSKSIVTHNYLGLEFIEPYKSLIIESYNETWYYNLVSILLQHHGDYEAPCRTLASFIVHRADEFDATMTLLCQQVESVNNASGERIKFDNKYLVI